MLRRRLLNIFYSMFGLALLSACSFPPHVQDWDRDRISEIPAGPIVVNICFDRSEHPKEEVLELARQECRARIIEVQNLVHFQELQQVRYIDQAEGDLFAGPVERKRNLDAILKTLQLGYVSNDVWDCPLTTRNRLSIQCLYDVNATDSTPRKTQQQTPVDTMDMPPKLPDDLKPR